MKRFMFVTTSVINLEKQEKSDVFRFIFTRDKVSTFIYSCTDRARVASFFKKFFKMQLHMEAMQQQQPFLLHSECCKLMQHFSESSNQYKN